MTEPLVVEFDVRGSIEHAFTMWTDRCKLWWPRTHTITGDPVHQGGWERLGAAGPPRRARTGQAWAAISEWYAAAC